MVNNTIIDQIRSETNCDFIAIALVEPAENQNVLKWKFASGNLNNRFKKIVLQSGRGVAGVVFKTGKPLLIQNVCNIIGEDKLYNYPILSIENLKSIGAVPLWHNGRVAGVLLGGFRNSDLMTQDILQVLLEISKKGIGNLDGRN